MKILVIGGSGFIGSHVVRRLLSEGHCVAVFHRGLTAPDLPASAIHFHGERERLEEFAPEFRSFLPETVIDMFAYTDRDARLVVRVFRGSARRLVLVSSMDVYRAYGIFRRLEAGMPDGKPFDEKAPLRNMLYPYRSLSKEPNDLLYDYDKILVEQVVTGAPDLPTIILRLAQVFGPGDSQHRLAAYLKRMGDGRDILLDEGKTQWRWTRGYVEDVAFAIALAATHRTILRGIYNVGEPRAQTELEWVKKIGEAAGWSGEIRVLPSAARPEDLIEPYNWNQSLAADTSRIREELGYHEIVSSEEALRRAVAWERVNPLLALPA